jgi:hypothetical protein
LIHNVYFLAGATYTKPEKMDEQASRFVQVINGRLVNCKTKNDSSLTGFQMLYKQDSYGRCPYF